MKQLLLMHIRCPDYTLLIITKASLETLTAVFALGYFLCEAMLLPSVLYFAPVHPDAFIHPTYVSLEKAVCQICKYENCFKDAKCS